MTPSSTVDANLGSRRAHLFVTRWRFVIYAVLLILSVVLMRISTSGTASTSAATAGEFHD